MSELAKFASNCHGGAGSLKTLQWARDMANATFDTHRLIDRLQKGGMNQTTAEAISDALKEAYSETELVTKKDLEIALSPIKTDIAVLKWMSGVVIAGIAALILKTFFAS